MKDMMENMKEKQTPFAIGLADVFNFLGGISGLIALITIVFYGGGLVEKLRSLDARVTTIEANGSSTVREHEKLDDQRELIMQQRLRMLEDNLLAVHRLETKVETFSVKLDALKEQLEKHALTTPK